MNLGPIAGLLGAALASLSVFKWILAGFIGVMILWIFSTSRNTKNALDNRAIKDLIKSAAQWNTRATQDSNPIIALMNSNYAVAYLNVARSLGSDAEIERVTGISIDTFLQDLESTQAGALQKMTNGCPNVTPQGLAVVHSGWIAKGR